MRSNASFMRNSTAAATALVILLSSMPDLAFAKRLGSGSSVGRQQSGITQRRAEPTQRSTQPGAAPAQQAAPTNTATPATPASGAAPSAPAGAASTSPAAAAQRPAAPTSPAAQQPARNRWLAPLAGLAAGIGLAALASHLGFGEELASFISSFLLIALLAIAGVFIYRMLTRSRRAATANRTGADFAYGHAGAATGDTPAREPVQRGSWGGSDASSKPIQRTAAPAFNGGANAPLGTELNVYGQPVASVGQSSGFQSHEVPAADAPLIDLPEGFDTTGFLRAARSVFVKLQAANDKGDIVTLREFVSDDLLAIFRDEIASRGAVVNVTDVVALESELVAYERDFDEHIASVLFSGSIREGAGAPTESFQEIWNLSRPVRQSGGWTLVGIQSL